MVTRLQNPETHDAAGWSARAAELDIELGRLQAALAEALDGWEEEYLMPEDRDRIAELRKLIKDV